MPPRATTREVLAGLGRTVGPMLGRIGARAGSAMMQSTLRDVGDIAQIAGNAARKAAQKLADRLPREVDFEDDDERDAEPKGGPDDD